ncbi:MAG: hypothetical protein LBT27_10185 [Prevotellaceae bacterium]|jgi:hypothetical protein|nr:hypothetical protein [Prevotellaceae bacterium]
MKKLTISQMETTNGGKFIGTTTKCTDCLSGHRYCTAKDYIFWLKVGDTRGWTEDCTVY